MSFGTGMKHVTLALATALLASAALAADTPKPAPDTAVDKVDAMVKAALPVCGEAIKINTVEMQHKLPPNLAAKVYQVDSERASCQGQYVAITSREGGFYLGVPWFLDDAEGKTIEERLKSFTWKHMQQNFDPVVDRTRTRDGLYRVVMNQTTERGRLPLEGEVDPDAKVFFLGHFQPIADTAAAARLKAFAPFISGAPSTGASNPAVTVIEFSDFECPSCQHASHYLEPLLARYPDQVRYIRYDLPLVNSHPWAFPAAVAGRAIYRQKPELFWDYKKTVYENQDKLSAFTIDDFARGFAQDHDLDVAKYDADIASDELKSLIMKGAAVALSTDIRATPSYLVNGTLVDAGDKGKHLESYVASLLKK
jgi:protein-disulfide isomerase